ncbi:MAG: hypothetical protein WCS37_02105 [Chloroflexota bacterium]
MPYNSSGDFVLSTFGTQVKESFVDLYNVCVAGQGGLARVLYFFNQQNQISTEQVVALYLILMSRAYGCATWERAWERAIENTDIAPYLVPAQSAEVDLLEPAEVANRLLAELGF